jgi:hypothetical protein
MQIKRRTLRAFRAVVISLKFYARFMLRRCHRAWREVAQEEIRLQRVMRITFQETISAGHLRVQAVNLYFSDVQMPKMSVYQVSRDPAVPHRPTTLQTLLS